MQSTAPKIEIRNLTMAYGSYVVMRDISARIQPGSVFVIMGGSGCGKSTLLRHLIGMIRPARGMCSTTAGIFGRWMTTTGAPSSGNSGSCFRVAPSGVR